MDVIAENEDPSNTTEANVGSAGKQQKKEPLKVVEETPKPPEAMIKPEKQEVGCWMHFLIKFIQIWSPFGAIRARDRSRGKGKVR